VVFRADFAEICSQVHYLHSLLPLATDYSVKYRLKGQSFELPRYNNELTRKSYALKCLYEFK